jgi:hypothetical protein
VRDNYIEAQGAQISCSQWPHAQHGTWPSAFSEHKAVTASLQSPSDGPPALDMEALARVPTPVISGVANFPILSVLKVLGN